MALVGCSNQIDIDESFWGEGFVSDASPEMEACPGGCAGNEVCIEGLCDDLCEEERCMPPDDGCQGETVVRFTGAGRCRPADGSCNFDAVRVVTDCLAVGRVCRSGRCILECEGEGCGQPQSYCEGQEAISYRGDGFCDEDGECDFSMVESRLDCRSQGLVCDDGSCVEGREHPLISEVFFDAIGSDEDREWIELYNPTPRRISLDGYSIGAGGSDYARGVIQLQGAIDPDQCFLVGGPLSDENNASPPDYNHSVSFNGILQNSGRRRGAGMGVADGVALFSLPKEEVEADTVPVDAVVYGGENSNMLMNASGDVTVMDLDVDDTEGQSLERLDENSWRLQAQPTPNDCDLLRQ